jgi:hypothetical protein
MVMANKTNWVLVETVSMYRMRYVVECPVDHPEYALDTVTAEQAKEFSQSHIGETIISSRVISEEEALAMCDVDNIYQSSWTKEEKIKGNFTRMEDIDASA